MYVWYKCDVINVCVLVVFVQRRIMTRTLPRGWRCLALPCCVTAPSSSKEKNTNLSYAGMTLSLRVCLSVCWLATRQLSKALVSDGVSCVRTHGVV